MLIVGAKGFAKEVLEVLHQLNSTENVVFYDDVNTFNPEEKVFDIFPILKSLLEVQNYFSTIDSNFTIGIGNPVLRKKLKDKFENIGGTFSSTVSPYANIGHYGNSIANGCNIMTGVVITSNVILKEGVLVNLNSTIGHDCVLGSFVELSPGVSISGNCSVGNYSTIGTNATVLPEIVIGVNVTIGAGAVVNMNIPDNSVAVGVPAKIIKQLPKIIT